MTVAEQFDADVAIVTERLQRLVGAPVTSADLRYLVHAGLPIPKARARTGKGGRHFTPRKTVAGERDLAYCFRTAVPDRPLLTNVAIVAVFYLSDRRRTDADNLFKLVMDAATKANVWSDDCQVTAQAAYVELDRARPRTLIALCRTSGTLDRTIPPSAGRPSLPLPPTDF